MFSLDDINSNHYSPWIRLDISLWGDIIKDHLPIKYKKNTIIYHQNEKLEYIYIVKSGRARITVSDEEGAEKHIFIVEAGSIIGEMDSFLKKPSTTAAIAIVDMEIYRISEDEFWSVICLDKKLNNEIMKSMAMKYNILLQQVSDMSFYESYTRVIRALFHLVNQYGIEVDEGYKIGIKFTHQDIAYLINTSRVNVSNIFSQLTSDGIINRKGGSTYIIDMLKLKSRLL